MQANARENILLVGHTGAGDAHVATALGDAKCSRGELLVRPGRLDEESREFRLALRYRPDRCPARQALDAALTRQEGSD